MTEATLEYLASELDEPERQPSNPKNERQNDLKNKKSPPDLAAKQGLNGGWEFAKLSFPC